MILSRMACAVLAALTLAGAPSAAQSQEWPSRPVTIIVPFAAGGSLDALARLLANDLGERVKGQFIVENRTGAAGNIGGAAVAKAAPDGHTLLFATNGPGLVNKLIYKQMQYDPEKDLAPIIRVAEAPLIIVAGKNSAAPDLQGMLGHAKANPNKLNYGTPGIGTLGHITAQLLIRKTGALLTHLPYRGTPPLMQDLIGGQIDLGFDLMPAYAPMVNDGSLRGLAVSGSKRSALLPNVPTVAETGIIDFEAVGWYALFAPAGTPPAIIEKLNTHVNAFLKSDKAKAALATFGMEAIGGTSEELKKFLASELAKWEPVVREANIAL